MSVKKSTTHRKLLLWVFPICLLLAIFAVVAACAPSTQQSVSQGQSSSNGSDGNGDNNASENETPSVNVTWSSTVDCNSCHQSEAESETDASYLCGFMIDSGADLACMDCHNDIPSLEKAHKNVSTGDKTPSGLQLTQITSDQCTRCHDKEEIKTSSTGSTVLTDLNGTVVNPHDIPLEGHYDHQAIVCADCHKMHAPVEDRSANAMDLCTGCHHQAVFECGTCHEE